MPCTTSMESAAIDFARLRREERRRARHGNNNKKPAASSDEVCSEDAAAVASSSSSGVVITTAASSPSPPFPRWDLSNIDVQHVRPLDLNEHLLSQDPPCLYYIDDFLRSREFAAGLVSWLQALPEVTPHRRHHNNNNDAKEEYRRALGRWTRLRHAARRVALFDARILTPLPEPLGRLARVLEDTVWRRLPATTTRGVGPINHILVNEYTETQGILGHTDGPAYDPCTVTLSLASDAVLHFTPTGTENRPQPSHRDQDSARRQVWLAANSLVVFTQQLYRDYQHSIADGRTSEHLAETCWNGTPGQAVRRGPLRYSLTFRCKTSLEV